MLHVDPCKAFQLARLPRDYHHELSIRFYSKWKRSLPSQKRVRFKKDPAARGATHGSPGTGAKTSPRDPDVHCKRGSKTIVAEPRCHHMTNLEENVQNGSTGSVLFLHITLGSGILSFLVRKASRGTRLESALRSHDDGHA